MRRFLLATSSVFVFSFSLSLFPNFCTCWFIFVCGRLQWFPCFRITDLESELKRLGEEHRDEVRQLTEENQRLNEQVTYLQLVMEWCYVWGSFLWVHGCVWLEICLKIEGFRQICLGSYFLEILKQSHSFVFRTRNFRRLCERARVFLLWITPGEGEKRLVVDELKVLKVWLLTTYWVYD